MSVVTAKRLDASRITGATHLITRQPRVLGRCSPFRRREFRHRRWRRRERSPTVLAKYSRRRIGRGFHGLSNGRAAPRGRGNPWDARGADRGGASDGPAGPGAGRHAGYARHGHRRHGRARHRDFRKPPNPGRPTAAISSPAALAVPQNSFSRRRHAECALRHRWLARRHHDQRRGTHRSVHGSKRANSGHRRDRACRETGEARARLPASGRPGSRGRGAGPGDDHPDDHPHQLEWTRRAADRI